MKERGCCCRRKTKADKAGWFYFLSFGKVHTSIIHLSIAVINPPMPSFSFCLLILSLFFPFCLLLPNETPVYPFALSLSLFPSCHRFFFALFFVPPGRRGHLFPFFLLVFVPPGTHTHKRTHSQVTIVLSSCLFCHFLSCLPLHPFVSSLDRCPLVQLSIPC